MTSKIIDIEKVLFQRLLNNDKSAFEEIYNRYHDMLYALSKKILRDEAMANDAVQKVFIRLWERKLDITVKESLKAYLFGSVKNQCLEQLRREKTRCFYESEYCEEMVSADPAKSFFNNEDFKNELEKAMEALPERSKEVFDLCKQEGLSQQEAAEHLGIAVKSVSNHMGIAVKKLRAYFGNNNVKLEVFYS